MEKMSAFNHQKHNANDESSSKSFKLFGRLIEFHGVKKHEGGSSSGTNEANEAYKGVFLGPKILTKSDTDASSRLLLGRDLVMSGIRPFLDETCARRCETVDGARINVYDLDTNTNHELVLKMWKSNSFVLTGNWNKDFVKRRNLQKNDEIGLYWDEFNSKLNFTILKKFRE